MLKNATRNSPSSTASACIAENGSRNRRFLRSGVCPSVVLSSSAVSVMNLPEATRNLSESIRTTIPRRARIERLRRAQKPTGRYRREAGTRRQKRATRRPPFSLISPCWRIDLAGSVRGFAGRPVRHGLVASGRCRCGVRGGGLDAMQQVGGGLQRLVVLGVRRHVGLRTGLLVAVILQMAAQRGLTLGVGTRLQLVRHVLQHLDIGHDALGLDRLAGWRVIARGGQAERAVAAAERDDGLHRTLAARAGADQRRTLVVLQRA